MSMFHNCRSSFLIASVCLGGSLLGGPALANPAFDEGVALLKEKNASAAIAAFDRCIESAEADVVVDCHWESGWAHWIGGDWAARPERHGTLFRRP